MKSAGAGLAADALNALNVLLLHVPATRHPPRELRGYLREALATEHTCGVVEMNCMINEALIEPHLAAKSQKTATGVSAALLFFSASNPVTFALMQSSFIHVVLY